MRPGIDVLDFRRCLSLDSHQGGAKRQVELQLLLWTIRYVWQCREQLQGMLQVVYGLLVRMSL
jgi:hypothetical protein